MEWAAVQLDAMHRFIRCLGVRIADIGHITASTRSPHSIGENRGLIWPKISDSEQTQIEAPIPHPPSSIRPIFSKASRRDSFVVDQLRPPTKSFLSESEAMPTVLGWRFFPFFVSWFQRSAQKENFSSRFNSLIVQLSRFTSGHAQNKLNQQSYLSSVTVLNPYFQLKMAISQPPQSLQALLHLTNSCSFLTSD